MARDIIDKLKPTAVGGSQLPKPLFFEMKLQPAAYDKIRTGIKVIELRLYDEKRQLISLGDHITFFRQPSPGESMTVQVVALLRYPSFSALISDFPCAWFGGSSRKELLAELRRYYSEEDEKRYGIVGIKVQRVEKT